MDDSYVLLGMLSLLSYFFFLLDEFRKKGKKEGNKELDLLNALYLSIYMFVFIHPLCILIFQISNKMMILHQHPLFGGCRTHMMNIIKKHKDFPPTKSMLKSSIAWSIIHIPTDQNYRGQGRIIHFVLSYFYIVSGGCIYPSELFPQSYRMM